LTLTDWNHRRWTELHHAYGTAEALPTLLRKLASTDKVEWKKAFDQISNAVVHQGSRFSASAAVVPCLLELLDQDNVLGKAEIIGEGTIGRRTVRIARPSTETTVGQL
jgi:hypothetical protein